MFLHPASAKGVIVLALCVCVCVILSVCLTLTVEWTDVQTWILVCRSSGRIPRSALKVKVKGHRSKVKVPLRHQHSNAGEARKWLMQMKLVFLQQAVELEESVIQHHIWMVGLRRGVFSKRMRFFCYKYWTKNIRYYLLLCLNLVRIHMFKVISAFHCVAWMIE